MAFERLTRPFRDARILSDAGGLLVIDKPPGVPVHGGDESLGADLVSRLGAWLTARGRDGYLGVHQRLDEGIEVARVVHGARVKNLRKLPKDD